MEILKRVEVIDNGTKFCNDNTRSKCWGCVHNFCLNCWYTISG